VRRSAAMLGGSAVGLGLGTMVQQAWEPTPASVAFATVIGAESAWIGGWLPTALDWDEPDGNIRTTLHAGVAGGLLYDHHQPLDEKTIGMLAYGGLLGNAFGAGVPMLATSDDEQVIAATMLPVGVAGMVAGGVVADDVELSDGDKAMIAVGTGMTMLESTAIGQVMYIEGIWCDERLQAEGLVLTTGALAGTGFTHLATRTEPAMVDMFFLASSAAWGAWYGAMVPIGFDMNLSDSAHILSTTFAADAFLAGGGLALAKVDGFESWQTAIPQLGGVAGATVGSLAIAMFSEEENEVALGAVIGSTAGLGVGSLLQAKKGDELGKKFQTAQSLIPKPHFLEKVPGEWSAMVLPQIDPTGELGANVSISGVGW